MATAEVKTTLEIRPVEVKTIVLELSMPEAETLMDIFARIGGSPSNSPRKHANAIQKALRDLGVDDPDQPMQPPVRDNAIYFADYPKDHA